MTAQAAVSVTTRASRKVVHDTRPPLFVRVRSALSNRFRLAWIRLWQRNIHFGAHCSIAKGLFISPAGTGSIHVGEHCVLDRFMTLESHGKINIGPRTIFGHHCTLAARDEVTIGSDCMFAEMVSIRDHDHNFQDLTIPVRDQGFQTAPVRIGKNVWVGAKATIVRGVTIGDNVIIGANAVVTHDIPDNAIAVGIPAKVIRTREVG